MLLASARESCAPGGRASSVICAAQSGQEPQGPAVAFLEIAGEPVAGRSGSGRLV